MTPTTDYDILSAPTPEELKALVKTAIGQGWVVAGGSYFANHNAPMYRKDQFYQTVIKSPNTLGTISSTVSNIQTHVASIDNKTPEA